MDRSWWRALVDPRMPGASAEAPPVRPGVFLAMLGVMVPLAVGRYHLGVLDTSDDQAVTVLLGLTAALGVFAAGHGVAAVRALPAAVWRHLALTTALYLVFWTWGRSDAFDRWMLPALGWSRAEAPLAAFAWFCINNGVVMLAPALLLARWVDGWGPGALGLSARANPHAGLQGVWPLYLGAFLVVLPFVIAAGTTDAFLLRYPIYRPVIGSDGAIGVGELLLCEALYLAQFAFLEAFFRGYVIFALEGGFGAYALPLMAVPYVAGHFGKPMPEAMGAIVAATLLGWLALKHRSIWWGVAVHVGVALVMDAMALWGRGVEIAGP